MKKIIPIALIVVLGINFIPTSSERTNMFEVINIDSRVYYLNGEYTRIIELAPIYKRSWLFREDDLVTSTWDAKLIKIREENINEYKLGQILNSGEFNGR